MKALHIAATGMMAQELNVEVISNNVANMRTTAFKAQRADFQDLLYENVRRMGTLTSDSGTIVPAGVQIGMGVKTAATPRIMTQGTITSSGKDFDLAIRGDGFFQIQTPDGQTAYTRDGSFELDSQGRLVTVDGYVVEPEITVPANARSFTVSNLGVVEVSIDGQTQPQNLGQIQLARFINQAGLEAIGDNLYLETTASGAPNVDNPGAEGFGNLLQAHLEQSNVNPVTEISDLIAAQRAYEMNARIISGADEMLSATANLR
jgi:flagellar basal-body rod protein FlgG